MKRIQFFITACLSLLVVGNTLEKRILLEDNYYTMISRIDALEKEVAALKANQAPNRDQIVAFMAELTHSMSGQNQQIIFDNVKLNIGNAYKPLHGNFIAPVSGLYEFTLSTCSAGGHYAALEINVNNGVLGKVLAGDTSYSDCNSKQFLVRLASGDDVFVQHVSVGDFIYAGAIDGLPTFTGLLIKGDA